MDLLDWEMEITGGIMLAALRSLISSSLALTMSLRSFNSDAVSVFINSDDSNDF